MRQAIIERPHPAGIGGIQRLYRFANGYGASVIMFPFSFGADIGLWELSVIKYDGDGKYSRTYETEIADEVIGNLTDSEVDELLTKIEALPDGESG